MESALGGWWNSQRGELGAAHDEERLGGRLEVGEGLISGEKSVAGDYRVSYLVASAVGAEHSLSERWRGLEDAGPATFREARCAT